MENCIKLILKYYIIDDIPCESWRKVWELEIFCLWFKNRFTNQKSQKLWAINTEQVSLPTLNQLQKSYTPFYWGKFNDFIWYLQKRSSLHYCTDFLVV